MEKLITKWHSWLDMPKKDEAWHVEDIARELAEYYEASGILDKWSEISDVVYTYTRARYWSGHKNIQYPLPKFTFPIGLLYMFPKFSLRWKFYRTVGKRLDKNAKLTEVRNPQKIEKLHHIANKYNLDPTQFQAEAKKLMKYWFFLK